MNPRAARLLAAALVVAALIAAAVLTNRHPQPVALVPSLTGQPEYCLTCHADVAEISAAHPVATFGCVRCHGGEPLALDADLAHATLRGGANPSDFRVVEASCGGTECHSGPVVGERDHIARATTSLQATYAGAIASVRYTFGAQDSLDIELGAAAILPPPTSRTPVGIPATAAFLDAFDPAAATNPSLQKFGENCLSCHLNAPPDPDLPQTERFTGCAACHTLTAGRDLTPLAKAPDRAPIHQLTIAIPYTQCNTCHNRGNYELRGPSFVPRADTPSDRLGAYYQPIAQFTRCEWELDCIDCHTRLEVMGDGHLYNQQKDIQYTECRTCHGTLTAPPATYTLISSEDVAFRLDFLNPNLDLHPGDTLVVTSALEAMPQVRRLPNGSFQLTAKASGLTYRLPLVQGSKCEQKPDEQYSSACHECHAEAAHLTHP